MFLINVLQDVVVLRPNGLFHMKEKKMVLMESQGGKALVLYIDQCAIFGILSSQYVSVFHSLPEPNSN